MVKKELIALNTSKGLMNFLQQPTIKIAEFLSGVLASDVSDYKLSAGHLVQAVIKSDLLTQLGKEITTYRDKGKIKDDILATDLNRASFKELLKFIDDEVPDEKRFAAMKSIFLTSISKEVGAIEQELGYELMQICKKLSSGDIVLLKAIYDIAQKRFASGVADPAADSSKDYWLHNNAKQIGHGDENLVELHEATLINLKLISDRRHADRSGIFDLKTNRLTGLGIKMCDFITRFK